MLQLLADALCEDGGEEIMYVVKFLRSNFVILGGGYKVDYIITHCAPDDIVDIIGEGMYDKDPLTNFLEEVRTSVDFKHWYFGHYHDDRHIGQKFTLLYDEIIPLE